MGMTNQERINLNSKVLQADVMDAVSSAVWFESRLFAGKVIDARQTWTEFATLETLPASTVAAAQANAAANPTLISDLSAPANAVRLTEVTASNKSTYVALTTFGDFASPRLKNWLQPQQIPQATGAPSIGYAIRLFNGDPAAGGVEIFTTDGQTGTGVNKSSGWVWNYSNGILLLSDDFYAQTGISSATFDPHVLGFRYIGPTAAGGGLASEAERIVKEINQVAHGFAVGEAIYFDGTSWILAQANDATTLATHLVLRVVDVDNFVAIQSGYMTGLAGLTSGEYYFTSASSAGSLTSIDPATLSTTFYSNPMLLADSATSGWVLPWRSFGQGSGTTGGSFVATTTTSDGTPTTLLTIPTPTDGVQFVEVKILARQTAPVVNNTATYKRSARIESVGGTPTIFDLQSDYTSEDVASWDGTMAIIGTSLVVQVTGTAATTIDWRASAFVETLS